MPELPEVETIRVGLKKYLPKLTIESVNFDTPKSFPNDPTQVKKYLIGSRIKDVRRRAKVLIIDLDSGYSLVIHLKMTGQLIFIGEERWGGGHPTDSLVGELPDRSTRVTFCLSNSSAANKNLSRGGNECDAMLYFNDQRKFGWVKLFPTVEVPEIDFFRKVGPEPLGPEFSWQYFKSALNRRKRTSIKAAILDQTVLAGVGNIYADESLFIARIHPATKVEDVPEVKLKALWRAIPQILQLSIDKGGSSDRNYVDADGNRGSYLKFASVFRRDGQACPRCGTTIAKIRVAGRGTHYCPKCQKIKTPTV